MNKTYNDDDKKINNTKKNKELLITKINDKKYLKNPRFFKSDLDFQICRIECVTFQICRIECVTSCSLLVITL